MLAGQKRRLLMGIPVHVVGDPHIGELPDDWEPPPELSPETQARLLAVSNAWAGIFTPKDWLQKWWQI